MPLLHPQISISLTDERDGTRDQIGRERKPVTRHAEGMRADVTLAATRTRTGTCKEVDRRTGTPRFRCDSLFSSASVHKHGKSIESETRLTLMFCFVERDAESLQPHLRADRYAFRRQFLSFATCALKFQDRGVACGSKDTYLLQTVFALFRRKIQMTFQTHAELCRLLVELLFPLLIVSGHLSRAGDRAEQCSPLPLRSDVSGTCQSVR